MSVALTDLAITRTKNRADQRRASAIANVAERLDVFAAVAVVQAARLAQYDYHVLCREHATRIVDAVLALTRVPDGR